MSKEVEYKGTKYWVTIDPAMHVVTKEGGFIAYVSDTKPEGLLLGAAVKNPEGKAIFFGDELTALTNANAIKQSEIDSRN